MLTHYVLMRSPVETEKDNYNSEIIDGIITVYTSKYFNNFKGSNKIVDLKELYWGKELQLIDV